ncbi:MAG: tetratricopeptide repeat protein [Armatimonadota bacterium]
MIGQIIGNYKIEERIKSQEQYAIYRAKDTIFNVPVYLKILSHKIVDNQDVKKNYLSCASQYLKLKHPNILNLLKTGDEGGYTYLAYENFSIKTLYEYLGENPALTLHEKMDIFFQICKGLSYAHQDCILHGNLTAGNVFIDNNKNIKIVDFGISAIEMLQTEIHQNQILEGFYYFPPEKINKEPLDEKSDLYSLGVLLFYILSRKYPFEAEGLNQLFGRKLEGHAASISSYVNDIPQSISDAISKLIKNNKQERYLNIKELLNDINNSGLDIQYNIPLSPKQSNWFVNKAGEAYLAGDINASIENWTKAIEFDPYNPGLYTNLSKIYLEQGDYAKAAENYKKALSVEPFKTSWRVELANLLKKSSQFGSALSEYEIIKKLDSKYLPYYFNAGNCLYFLKRYGEAITVWLEGLKRDPDKLRLLYNLGVAEYAIGKTEKALEYWSKVLEINKNFVKASYNLSIVELNNNNTDKAFLLWEELDKISNMPEIKLNLGNSYYNKKDHDKAMEYWSLALELNKDCWQAYFNLGIYYFGKDINKSREMFEKASQAKPDLWLAYWNLGYVAQKDGDHKASSEYFDKVLQLNPGYWQANYYLGEKLIKENKMDEAQKCFMKIFDTQTDFSEDFCKNMGAIFYKNSQIDKAVDCWAKTVSHHNFQWDEKDDGKDIPDRIYKAAKIMVQKELKEKGDGASFFVHDQKVHFNIKPELIPADCGDIIPVIDY